MGFGRSKAKVGSKEMPDVTFDDVAGEDEAVEELEEIREFLSEPEKFRAVGAKIPKGVGVSHGLHGEHVQGLPVGVGQSSGRDAAHG